MKKKATLELVEQILVLGNGDIKTTAKYEEDKRLFGYALDLQKFNKLLSKDLEDGVVTVEERTLTNIEDKTYLI
ncbi:MAG: hypothetical protein IKS82_00865 [Bacteroidales bacterium]|nr:hypothetical protein [Bacteroidales bacterium]